MYIARIGTKNPIQKTDCFYITDNYRSNAVGISAETSSVLAMVAPAWVNATRARMANLFIFFDFITINYKKLKIEN